MVKHIFVIFSTVCLILSFAWTQNPDPLEFFPHHEGDVWEYLVWDAPNEQNIILSDSLGDDGRYYLETTMFGPMIVDTVNLEVYVHLNYNPNGSLLKWYKLDAQQGESWRVLPGTSFIGKVDTVIQGYLFGQPTVYKVIGYYEVFGPESLWVATDFIASGFGFLRRNVEFDPYWYLLSGAIIDSVLYGNVTVPIEPKRDPNLPQTVTLHQNYPNPFNPTTTIRYELPKADRVKLLVYDPLGREVEVLVDEDRSAGPHLVHFDGKGLPDGIYFYRLRTSQGVVTKKMLLLR